MEKEKELEGCGGGGRRRRRKSKKVAEEEEEGGLGEGVDRWGRRRSKIVTRGCMMKERKKLKRRIEGC